MGSSTSAPARDGDDGLPRDIVPVQKGVALAKAVHDRVMSRRPYVEAAPTPHVGRRWAKFLELANTTSRASHVSTVAEATKDASADQSDFGVLDVVSTLDEVKQMRSTDILSMSWRDEAQRLAWGIAALSPGDVLVYNGAFGSQAACHYGVYLGRIGIDMPVSPSLDRQLDRATRKLATHEEMGDITAGGVMDAGTDLVIHCTLGQDLTMRVLIEPLQGFIVGAEMFKSQLFRYRDPMNDTVSSKDGTPVWFLRALNAIGIVNYSSIRCNCEHVAMYITTGCFMSYQADIVKNAVTNGATFVRRLASALGLSAVPLLMGPPQVLVDRIARARPKRRVFEQGPVSNQHRSVHDVGQSAQEVGYHLA